MALAMSGNEVRRDGWLADAAGTCVPWEVVRKRRRPGVVALRKHTELLADLCRRFGKEPHPDFLWDAKTGTLQLGGLKATGLLRGL